MCSERSRRRVQLQSLSLWTDVDFCLGKMSKLLTKMSDKILLLPCKFVLCYVRTVIPITYQPESAAIQYVNYLSLDKQIVITSLLTVPLACSAFFLMYRTPPGCPKGSPTSYQKGEHLLIMMC